MKFRTLLAMPLLVLVTATGCAAEQASTDDELGSTTSNMTEALSWQNIGGAQVDGGLDHDAIIVGADEGMFRSIKVKVQGSSLVMFDIKITFGNGETYSPNTRLEFNEGSSSREIDLPGGARNIERVDFRYANLPGGGKADIQLVGKTDAPSPWESLGERRVDGGIDHDVIRPEGNEPVTAIKLRVDGSSLVMFDVKVTFGNGQTYSPNTRLVFDERSHSRVIDLPGAARNIAKVELRYANLPSGGKAHLRLLGKMASPSPWQGLGQREVDGHYDHDRINVGADEGTFTKLELKVQDSDLVMFDVKVTFGNDEVFSPPTRFVFDESSRSRVIDLPGEARKIKHVDFRYGNLPGSGQARVQLRGKH